MFPNLPLCSFQEEKNDCMFTELSFVESSVQTAPRGTRLCSKYFSFNGEKFEETCDSWLKDIANNGENVNKECGITDESHYRRRLQNWYNGIRNRLAEIWAVLNEVLYQSFTSRANTTFSKHTSFHAKNPIDYKNAKIRRIW